MHQPTDEYVTVAELERDLATATGNPALAKKQAMSYAIYYRGLVIDSAKYKGNLITKDDLEYSRHIQWEHAKKHSEKLCENMHKAGRGSRPGNVEAHHIVAWDAKRAVWARLRLAAFGIDIDHEANGVYLPNFKRNVPIPGIPTDKSHRQTHTPQYYMNVEFLLKETIAEGLGRRGIIETLREIGEELYDGEFPLRKLIKKEQ
ncbi:hypothetical protein EZV61_13855 [Corallincola luteus]|uniref:HNH endonuclease n=1 Tax=Corallincola luteus TaxID=1775177 RepID=A0ABY2AIC8_9GAMM|nr:AHH domain-containing protein [Corallincola luteus]TCI02437.1 hypothetical protein EZV61_13855 [Corallincola luteus]